MGFQDALRDNIKYKKNSMGDTWYYPKCNSCGEEIPVMRYKSGMIYTCKKCKLEKRLSDEEKKIPVMAEIRRSRLETAVERIQAHDNIQKYEHAIDTVEKMIEDGGHIFDSTEEVMTALILLKNGIQFRHQVKFGRRYIADFVLDEMKVVLEIDGDIFHCGDRLNKQQIRDDLIIASLGPSWEIVRIKTSVLNKNITRLPRALKAILKKREIYRRFNKGQLPDWYNAEG